MPNLKIVKGGTIDDAAVINASKPAKEIYCKHRIKWTMPIPEAHARQNYWYKEKHVYADPMKSPFLEGLKEIYQNGFTFSPG